MPVMQRPATPVPFGVEASTGHTRAPILPIHPDDVLLDRKAVRDSVAPQRELALVPTLDPVKLSETGWAVLFATDADPQLREALEPLIQHRRSQMAKPEYLQVFDGIRGVAPGQSAAAWLASQGVGLATVDPENGIPYYLLVVGAPDRISFEFQYTLDLFWCVGRLDFERFEDYALYASAVVAYERSGIAAPKKAALWMPANEGDLATGLLCNDVGLPFVEQNPLGRNLGFALTSCLGPRATKENLELLLRNGNSVIFTGSHGLEIDGLQNPEDERARQGALVTQEWIPGQPVGIEACFTAADLEAAAADCSGLVHVMFACFGGGCPMRDNYPEPGGVTPPRPLSPKPFVSALPRALLRNGALAVLGHIDRAWNYSFQSGAGLPQNQVLRSVLEVIMMGRPVGLAADYMNLQWGALAAQLGMLLEPGADPYALTNLVIARDDARNYALFGDPAVRLNTIPGGSWGLPS